MKTWFEKIRSQVKAKGKAEMGKEEVVVEQT